MFDDVSFDKTIRLNHCNHSAIPMRKIRLYALQPMSFLPLVLLPTGLMFWFDDMSFDNLF